MQTAGEKESQQRSACADRQVIEVDGDAKPSTAWLPNSVLIQPKPVGMKIALQDNLLVSAMGGNAGLLAINKGNSPKVRVLDRLNSAGIWIGYRSFVRAIYCQQTIIHLHLPDQVSIITNPNYTHVHDVRVQFGQLLLVSTGTNEVVQLDFTGKLLRRWKFPGEGDTRHLNCLDLWNGRYVVSCFGRFEKVRQFKDDGTGAGIVFDLETDETLWDGLTYPHTPRMHKGRQYVCDSRTNRLLMRECGSSEVRELNFPGAFTRGIAFGAKHMYVGLSAIRNTIFQRERGQDGNTDCGVGGKNGAYVIETQPDAKAEQCKPGAKLAADGNPGNIAEAKEKSISSAKIAVIDIETYQWLDEIDLPCSEVYEIVVPPDDGGDSLLAYKNAI
jgi:hypothetical protein